MTTICETLAAYAERELTSSLSDTVRHHARRALIDWFAALLPGAQLAPATLLVAGLADEIGHGRAIVYGRNLPASLRTAALINATASHTIEFDDIFRDAVYHPGCSVIAAALAAAQAKGASGEDLLRAIVVGYEISTRIGVAVQPSHYRFWHTTGTIGTFGAAAAVASILKLDAGRTAHALATAGTFAAALQQAFRSDAMSKPLHAGHAADAGAMAALGAAQGVTGALDVLEGAAGFGAAMSVNPDWSKAIDGLGARYNITAMTFKNHGCCVHAFAAIDGALALQQAPRALVHRHAIEAEVGRHPAHLGLPGQGHQAGGIRDRHHIAIGGRQIQPGGKAGKTSPRPSHRSHRRVRVSNQRQVGRRGRQVTRRHAAPATLQFRSPVP